MVIPLRRPCFYAVKVKVKTVVYILNKDATAVFPEILVRNCAALAERTPELAARVRRGREGMVDSMLAGVTTESKVREGTKMPPANHSR